VKFNKLFIAFSFAGAAMVSNLAQAIEVFPVVKEIRQQTPRENYVTVKSAFRAKSTVADNKSDTQQYEFVTLELFHVPNPGDATEKREKELGSADPTLVFSPTRLVIPYGEERKVRLMPLKSVDHEQVYRLRIRPSYPEQALDKGKVRFAVGYDVLIRYLPDGKQTQALSVTCRNNQWTLSALGNVRTELRDLVVDGHKSKQQFNVYPEHSRVLTVAHRLAFSLGGKTQVYENCQLKG